MADLVCRLVDLQDFFMGRSDAAVCVCVCVCVSVCLSLCVCVCVCNIPRAPPPLHVTHITHTHTHTCIGLILLHGMFCLKLFNELSYCW